MFMETSNLQIKVVGKIQLSEEDLKKKRFVTGKSQYAHIANVNKANYDNASEDSVNVLYKELERLEMAPKTKNLVTDMRTILEFAFYLRKHPDAKFGREYKTDNKRDTLSNAIKDYYCDFPEEISAKKVVDEIRARLNNIIHNSIFVEVSEQEIEALLNKVRAVLDGLFSRSTRNSISRQFSFFDVNQDQLNAVNSNHPVTLVNAGPGTGKTHLIVDRMIHSANECINELKDSPKNIIGMAYTNEAARQLKDRYVYTVFGSDDYKGVDCIQICTIHSFAFNTLKDFYEKNNQVFDYEVVDANELDEITKDCNGDKTRVNHFLEENRLLTFDMILSKFDFVVKTDIRMKEYLTDSIYEIILDEAQDSSIVAADILKRIFDVSNGKIRIFLVGDQRQNIFAFNTGSIHNFSKVGFTPYEYTLHRCYRCPNTLLDFVNTFKFSDCDNGGLHRVEQGQSRESHKPECWEFANEDDERKWITSRIKTLNANDHVNYNDMAVLLPDSYSFPALCNVFNQEGIPYECHGGKTELVNNMRQCLNYLGAIENHKFSLKKLLANLNVAFDPTVQLNKDDDVLDLLEADLKVKPIIGLLRKHRDMQKIGKYDIAEAIKDYGKETRQMVFFTDLVNAVKENEIVSYKSLRQKMSPNLRDFEKFYLKGNAIESLNKDSDRVVISTIHSAKGREWQYVFIPGVTDGKYPRYNTRATSGQALVEHRNNEQKKFYVACTRALKNLYLSWTRSYSVFGNDFCGRDMSDFIKGRENYLEFHVLHHH